MKSRFTKIIALSCIMAGSLFTASAVNDTIVKTGTSWKYLDNGSNQGTAWRATAFSDASWASGPSQLGYGDGDEATVVSYGPNASSKYRTTYFRKTVSLSNVSNYASITMKVKRDDGIVVYINGTERYRNNMPNGTITYTTLASNASNDGNTWMSATLPLGSLINGTNVIAVEIHQTNVTSSDITFDMMLYGDYACGTPTGLSSTSVTTSSATLNWAAGSGATNYSLQYKTAASATWTTISTGNVTSYNLTGLLNNTAYNWRVTRTCLIGTSAVTATQNFTTLATACSTPAGLVSSAVTTSSATASWSAVSGAASYDVWYREIGSPTWSAQINTVSTSLNITGLNYNTNYEWQVHTNCTGGNQSAWSASSAFTTLTPACNIPTGLGSSAITTSSATISWSAVTGASSYDVQYRVVGAGSWSAQINSATTSLNLSGLNYNSNYEWQVHTNCVYGNQSAWSPSATFTTLTPACNIPTGLVSSAITTSSATISWSAVTGASSYDVQYRVVGAGSWSAQINSATTSLNLSGLNYNSNYEWQVHTNCVYGNQSAWSPSATFTTLIPACNIPTGLVSSAITTSSATISWSAVTGASSYDVQYRVVGGGSWSAQINSTTTSLNLSGLNYNSNYEWQVHTNCVYGNQSSWSASSTFTTLIPNCDDATGLVVSNITTTSADLNWNAVANATSYDVQYRTVGSGTWNNVNTATNSLSIASLSPASNYEYQIRANCIYGNSSNYIAGINFTTATPNCDDATGLVVSNITTTSADLNWNAVANATSYDVQYRTVGSGTWSTVNTATNSLSIASLSPASNYEYQIRANCIYGNSSNYVAGINFTTATPNCDDATGLSVANISTTSANLNWNTVANAASYDVQYRTVGSGTWNNVNTATNSLSIASLSPASNYEYQIRANCIYGNSSNYVAGINFTTATPNCDDATGLVVSNITTTSADLSWSINANATSYDLQYRTVGSGTWNTVNTATNSFSLTSLSPASNYEWQVRANCVNGNSFYVSGSNFTTLTPPCNDVTNPIVSNIGTASADLGWDVVSGATGYSVQYRISGNQTWANANAATNSLSLTGLNYSSTYEWQVQTNCQYSNSNFVNGSNFSTLTPDCNVPSGLASANITSTSADLSWTLITGAATYDVQYREVGAPTWNAAINTASTSLALSGLNYNTNYEFQVRTNCVYLNQSAYSASSTFTTLTPVCSVPSGLASSAVTTSSATASWSAVTGAATYDVQYRVVGAGSWNAAINTASTSLALSGLNYNTNYEFQVRTNCVYLNQSAYSAYSTFTTLTPVCDVPTGQSSSAVTTSSATVSWAAVAGASTYTVQYRIVGAGSWITSANTASTSLGLTGLTYTSNYEWQVRTNCIYGNQSTFSTSSTFTTLTPVCDVPTGQSSSAVTTSSATVSWAAVAGASTYTVQYRIISAPSWTTAANTASTSLGLTGLTYTSNYEWQVRTNCIYGNQSAFTASATFTTLTPTCNVPTGLASSAITTSSATASWSAVTGAATYDVQYREVGAPTWNAAINTASTSLALSGLNYNTNYEFQVLTNCVYLNQSAYSASSTFTTLTPVCSVPSGLASSAVTTSSATASWSAVPGAATYDVQYRVVGAGSWNAAINTAATSLALSSLSYNTNYEFQVRTNCVYLNQSAYSASSTFLTLTPACNVPTGQSSSAVTTSTATVSWAAVAGASTYTVQYRIVGAGSWITSANTASTSLGLTGLTYTSNYEWQVRTNCIYGNQSAFSASATFTTLTPACNVPTGQASSSITASNATVSWSAVTGAATYDVQYRVVGAGSWNAAINTASVSLGLTGLSASTNYEWQVRTNCIYGNQSAYSSSATFATSAAVACNAPTGLSIASVTTTGGTASWTAVSGALTYTVRYRTIGNVSWTTSANTASTSLALTGLTTSKTYEVQVLTNCSGGSSSYSTSVDFTTSAATTILTRGPYLQMVTPTSIRIRWRSSAATNSYVRYGTDMSVSASTTDAASVTDHEVSVTGLTPGTKYFYTIGSTTVDYQGNKDNFFFTSLPTGSTAPFRIWATGDFGVNNAGQTNTRDAMETFTAGNRPGIWIWQGDNAYSNGTDAEYTNNVFNIYPNQFKNIPVYPCLGNHDYGQTGYLSATSLGTTAPYFTMFSCPTTAQAGGVASGTEKYYSYNYGNVHFIVLDSYGSLNAAGSAQRTWLQNDLAANTQRFTIAMWHHPPYSHGTHNSDTEAEMVDMRNNITPLLDQYKVDLVLNGHSHTYERTWLIKGHQGVASTFTNAMKIDATAGLSPYYLKSSATNFDGTVYCVIGVSGQGGSVSTLGTWPHNAMVSYSKTLWGSMIIDVSGDTLDTRFLTSTGTIYDRFKIVKSGAARIGNSTIVTGTKGNEVEAFPNPFSNELNVRFMLDKESPVLVEIYDLLGKKIYTSGNKIIGVQQAGTYELTISQDELNHAHGMVIIKVIANGKTMQTMVEKLD